MNARQVLGSMLPAAYFAKLKKMAFHDLTKGGSIPAAAAAVIGLGNKFIPTPKVASNLDVAEAACNRFERDMGLKVFFAADSDKIMTPSKLYIKSPWRPPLPPRRIDIRLSHFRRELQALFKRPRRAKPNLTPFQRQILRELMANDQVVIALADKNLGPVGVELERYIRDALVHLTNQTTYAIIPEPQALREVSELADEIFEWITSNRNSLTDDEAKYLRAKLSETYEEPFGYFYLTYKLHKTPVKTRPVCSDCASLTHALGQWVDEQLQPIVKAQRTYFKNSFALKEELLTLTLPSNASLFTFDTVSMYTNIDTEECISRLESYLMDPTTQSTFPHYPAEALVEAIKIIMRNNRMKFGDIIVRQLVGIAMGMAPAPTIANLFVALHEERELLSFLDDNFLLYLRRFIDDGLGIWLHHHDKRVDTIRWNAFKAAVNNGGLTWEFTPRSKQVDFMDLTIEIADGHIETKLYKKPLALHLYIPPSSCHPPGVATGLIFGNVLRILQLNTQQKNVDADLIQFYHDLMDRGYQPSFITPLFQKAIDNATKYLSQSPAYRQQCKQKKLEQSRRRVFLHLPYHPNDPTSATIQRLWRTLVARPHGQPQLNALTNHHGDPIPIDNMVIAYHRSLNLGNILSYRKICKRSGPKVSSYLD